MGRWRLILIVATVGVCLGALILAVKTWAYPEQAEIRAVPSGHQEIAWIAPATSGESWERLVAALKLLQVSVNIQANFDKAFLPLTADVPEIALYYATNPDAKLWIRWYKLSGENPSRRWFEKLGQRQSPPLAVIGGDTSDRALFQSRALQEVRSKWTGPAPLYFITSATADRYYPRDIQTGELPHSTWPKLMEVYDQRTFRFCFTNTRIVEAVLDFIRQNPQVCAQHSLEPARGAGLVAQGNILGSLMFLAAAGHYQPFHPATMIWKDDGYSKDLGEIFLQVFADSSPPWNGLFSKIYNNSIDYSVGDFLEPNPREAQAVGVFLADLAHDNPGFYDQPQLLALPTGAQPARRFLRTLCRRAPSETRNFVVVTGDAISFNTLFRDRNVAWNIQDMPVPLVTFCHRNPIDTKAGFGQIEPGDFVNHTGTQDVLLYRDIAQTLVLAVFGKDSMATDADQLRERLGHTRWSKGRILNDLVQGEQPGAAAFFDTAGNRRADTGEHIVWLRPVFDGPRILSDAILTVWRGGGESPDRTWHTFAPPLHLLYDRPNSEDTNAHGP